MSRIETKKLLTNWTQQKSWTEVERDFARGIIRDFASDFDGICYRARHFTRDVVRDFARNIVRDYVRYFVRDVVRDYIRYFVRDAARVREFVYCLARDVVGYFDRYFTRNFVLYVVLNLARDCARNFARNLARGLATDTSKEIIEDFARGEIFSWGRVGARSILAYERTKNPIPEVQLLSAACRFSLRPASDNKDLDEALARHEAELDPLWPALARHLARRSTQADRILLTDLAQHPERRDSPLAWGLQFIVRGDILFDDGSIATLDELCAEAGVPPLPYLEDLTGELALEDLPEGPGV
jgi:hypothetical protein